jgi:hypothetical protein
VADVARKLLIKPGDRVLVLDIPTDPTELLGPLPDGASLWTAPAADGGVDVAVAFSADLAAFRTQIPVYRRLARSARALWVAYPKLTSARAGSLSRDVIRTTLDETDITTVTQVAIDDTWSAIRLRPVEHVGR